MQTMQAAVDDFEHELEPLVQAQMLADWDAAIDASDEHEQQLVEASKRVDAVLSERERFARLVEADRNGGAEGGELARRVRLARLASEAGQRDRALADRIIESEARLGSLFSRHRGQLRGREVNDNEIAKVLRESSDRALAPRGLGCVQVDRPARGAARARARASAQRGRTALGYRDHFEFSLTLDELDETWLLSLLDDLEGRLSATWERTKAAIDEGQRARLGLARGEPLQAWDYADAFFQDAPTASDDPLEAALEHLDPVEVARSYFQALGDDVDGVIARSDLYPRDGKNQHAFCADIDRRHDVRVLANCEPGTRWLGDDGARARPRRLRPRDRRAAAVAAAPARAHVHDRGHRDAARAAGARRGVPRALRARRAGDRARSAQRRDAAPRAARVRALGAGHDALRARALPRSRTRTSARSGGSSSSATSASRLRPGRAPTTGRARSTSRWRRSTTTTTCSARSRRRSWRRRWRARSARRARPSSPAAAGSSCASASCAPAPRCAGMR